MTGSRNSVANCAYTEERRDQVLRGVDSVRAQSLACEELVLVVDHNRELYDRLAAGCSYVGMLRTRASVRDPIGSAASFRREIVNLVGGRLRLQGRKQGR